MRITSSAKYFFGLLFSIGCIVAAVFWLCIYHMDIAIIAGYVGMGIVFFFIGYVTIVPLFDFLGERATDIMAIYQDASGEGLHVFSSFNVSRIKLGLSPLCTIQYYYFVADNGKNHYCTLFTYSLESAEGRAGYVDFDSFEADVLPSQELKDAQERYSRKLGRDIKLGERSKEGENETYDTEMGGRTFSIVKRQGLIQDKLWLYCCEGERRVWRKKL